MGLLSKLLGGQKNEKAAVDFLKGLVNEVKEKAQEELSSPEREEARSMPEAERSEGASGDSWGDVMPEEENQYSFNGTYVEYFNTVFRAEFPSYRIECTPASGSQRLTVFTFYGAKGKALVVELKSENSEAQKLRKACAAEGVPYLRFYYDHRGWWNTRSYVVRRTLAALRG